MTSTANQKLYFYPCFLNVFILKQFYDSLTVHCILHMKHHSDTKLSLKKHVQQQN